jgi:Cu2+-exporting ATPase
MLLITACGSDKQDTQQQPVKQETKQDAKQASFYCPMKCEGEKTYTEAGSCAVCGMDLVKEDADSEKEMESHEGHNH